jgi:hypothetical protein
MDHRRDVRAVPNNMAPNNKTSINRAVSVDKYVNGTASAEWSLVIPLTASGVRAATMSSTVGGLGDIPTQANGPPIVGLERLHG